MSELYQRSGKWLAVIVLLLFPSFLNNLAAQRTNEEFGKNRVQYHEFTWSFFQSPNFVTYYYLGGQENGRFVVQVAEQELESIEKILDFKINNRIELLVYNDLADANQTNIGTGLDINNTGGVTRIIGNKVFVYFDGNHRHLREQVREGIAKVLINNMIYGGSLQEILQNAVLLNLPSWYVDGLVRYIGEPWNAELDNRLKDGLLSGRWKNFNAIVAEDLGFAGHAFWYFVAQTYGNQAIPNLLYLTRINRSFENAFLFVLGYPYREAVIEWQNYFMKIYEAENNIGTLPPEEQLLPVKNYKDRKIYSSTISRDRSQLAFVSNIIGKYRVHLLDLNTNKSRVVHRGGFKNHILIHDYNYPLLAFDPTGKQLVILDEKRDQISLTTYDLETGDKEKRDLIQFQRIVDISFTNDPRVLVMSAINRGQSDIYLYNLQTNRITQLTNDFYDDLQPAYVDFGDRKGYVFASNRIHDTLQTGRSDTILPITHFDIYFLEQGSGRPSTVLNLTNTPNISESQPGQITGHKFSFLSDQSGIQNRYAGYIDTIFSHTEYRIYYQDSTITYPDFLNRADSILAADEAIIDSVKNYEVYKDTAYTLPVTNYSRNILEHQQVLRGNVGLDLIEKDGQYQFYKMALPDTLVMADAPDLKMTTFRRKSLENAGKAAAEEKEEEPSKYSFQTEFQEDTASVEQAPEEDELFRPTQVLPYRVKFSTDYVLSQLDNSLVIERYQNFVGSGPVYDNPELSGLITLSISDLFENYRFTGGFRIPTTFSGSEYFLSFEDLRKRIDKKFTYYRRVNNENYNFAPFYFNDVRAKQKTNYFEGKFTYPIDVIRSIRFTGGFKNYKIEFLSADTFTLNLPRYSENWLQGRLEYVFDNTLPIGLNLMEGTRFKFYYEAFKQFHLNVDPGVDVDLAQGFTSVLGTDIRHYIRVHKNIVWANRVAAGTSFGSKKLIYYLGAVDNWLFPRFNQDMEVNMNNNYAFQTIATNMRGFWQNIRNGNSFAVANTELRVPIFSYLISSPIRSEFIRNFQLVGFGDIGTAWEGFSPFDQDNPFNTEEIERGPVKVLVRYFRNPIVGGYGFGARTMLFGYFIRADIAWGVDSGEVLKPVKYLSFGMDF